MSKTIEYALTVTDRTMIGLGYVPKLRAKRTLTSLIDGAVLVECIESHYYPQAGGAPLILHTHQHGKIVRLEWFAPAPAALG